VLSVVVVHLFCNQAVLERVGVHVELYSIIGLEWELGMRLIRWGVDGLID